MRRVAYATPLYFDESSYLGGGERYPLNLAKAVAGTGDYEVELVSYGDVAQERTLPLAERVSLKVLPSSSGRPASDRLSWDIVGALRGADLVHIHQIFCRASELALLASKLLHKPVCATDHGGAASSLGKSLGMLDLVDRITSYSRFGASLVEGHSSTPIVVVAGGVDDHFFTPPPTPVTRDRLLFVGRLLPHKGIDRLIAALPPDVPLTICGRPYDTTYYDLLRALATRKQVDFVIDATDQGLRALYRRAIAVILPSVYVDCYGHSHAWPELMGYSLLEGMACGAPAVCSRVGGMPEYVDHGVTGFIFDDLTQLREHIQRLASDSDLRARLGEAGRQRVNDLFGLDAAGSSMRSVYDALLEEQASQ